MGKHESIKQFGLSNKGRKYAYSVVIAMSPVAIAYGIVDSTQAGLWTALIGAVLGVSNSLALMNVPNTDNGGVAGDADN